MKLTAEYILGQFNNSGKKHLIITGWRGKGKTTLFSKIVNIIADGKILPGLTSGMVPKQGVMLRDNISGKEAAIGIYCPEKAEIGKNMIPYSDGFYVVGIPAMEYALKCESKWFSMDEIGFLESSEKEFQNAVLKTMEEKHLVAVIRKMEKGKVPFVDDILSREDVYILDLDDYDTSEYWD
ncbi:MAG: hypothetical protein E7484_05335 [Ruminococcaceae bacterium]|nr:hypothetical protein [Oscillospiraceae bacterium]